MLQYKKKITYCVGNFIKLIKFQKSSNKQQTDNTFIADVSTSTDIEVGNIVKYLPKDPASWIGVVTEIKNDEETKRHGHSGMCILYKTHLAQ